MRDDKTWKLAEIYGVRHAKFFVEEVYDEEVDTSDSNDDLPVLDHPEKQTGQENKQSYFKRYIDEIKEMQRIKDEIRGKKKDDHVP